MMHDLRCAQCRRTFFVYPSALSVTLGGVKVVRRFCSRKCYGDSRAKRGPACAWCGKIKPVRKQKFCSNVCSGAYEHATSPRSYCLVCGKRNKKADRLTCSIACKAERARGANWEAKQLAIARRAQAIDSARASKVPQKRRPPSRLAAGDARRDTSSDHDAP